MTVGVIELSVSRKFHNSGSSSPKRKVKCGRSWKTTPRIDNILIRSSKINPRKASIDISRDLLDNCVEVSSYTAWKRLLEGGQKVKRLRENTTVGDRLTNTFTKDLCVRITNTYSGKEHFQEIFFAFGQRTHIRR
ncbi:HTH_Tnp_Tc3_2 domain-containing protein [Trichonephila clavipes]|nr:HTH_Tnp_Tc3_2 domain-containing protein [Trichonephila clavipes]